jgi:hypothetical protein
MSIDTPGGTGMSENWANDRSGVWPGTLLVSVGGKSTLPVQALNKKIAPASMGEMIFPFIARSRFGWPAVSRAVGDIAAYLRDY